MPLHTCSGAEHFPNHANLSSFTQMFYCFLLGDQLILVCLGLSPFSHLCSRNPLSPGLSGMVDHSIVPLSFIHAFFYTFAPLSFLLSSLPGSRGILVISRVLVYPCSRFISRCAYTTFPCGGNSCLQPFVSIKIFFFFLHRIPPPSGHRFR